MQHKRILVTGGAGFVLRGHDDVLRPGSEPVEPFVRIHRLLITRRLGNKTLLRSLLRDTHARADLRPRRSRPARLVDEVTDQVICNFTEMISGNHGVGKLVESIGVHLLDRVDEVVESNPVGHFHWFTHASTIG